ncbi:MAG: hypothetical protein CSYNP_01178 [Syntrophus sp. SKADARSKE-3]|nr:hypothetical protein [Syntrophus sp. SKADARSKE-3]
MKLIGKIILVILVCVLVVECVMRVALLFTWESPLYMADKDTGYRMRPHITFGNVTVNASGFNDKEHDQKKNKNMVRMAVIGDSFVFGVVERRHNFTALIQEKADRSGKKIEVLNMGIPAAGPRQYLGLINKDAAKMEADIACVVFFVGNDTLQSHPDFETRIFAGSTRDVLARPYLMGLSLKYILSYRTLRATTRQLRERFKPPQENGTFTKESFLEIETERATVSEKTRSDFMKTCYASSIELIKKMDLEAKKRGITFFVVLAPDEFQVNAALQQDIVKQSRMTADHYDFQQPQRQMVRDLGDAGIAVLDLLPLYLADGGKRSYYIPRDTHWNEEGNRLAADTIWSFMESRRLFK